MNKLNRNIVNIINNYNKPLCYLKELQESIKYIKYYEVFYSNKYLNITNYIENSIIKQNNTWKRNNYYLILDYRLSYVETNNSIFL